MIRKQNVKRRNEELDSWQASITEIFTSIQGEGPTQGIPSHFIRLKGCGMRCPWCDTKHSWKEGTVYTYDQLKTSLNNLRVSYPNVSNVVITGGEPLEQDIGPIVQLCKSFYWTVEVETNGLPYAATPGDIKKKLVGNVDIYNVSPKLLTEKIIESYTPEKMQVFLNYNCIFKFVVQTKQDVEEVIGFTTTRMIPRKSVYIMPNALTKRQLEKHSEKIIRFCIELGLKFTTRLHIATWDKKRGV